MQITAIFVAAAFMVGAVESAEKDDALRASLLQALVDLGAAPMKQESEVLRGHVMSEHADMAGRLATFDAFFATHPFTENHANNLEAHIGYSTADRTRMIRFAGAFAAAAIRFYWDNPGAVAVAPAPALLFLEKAYAAGDESLYKAIAEGVDDALRGRPVPLRPFLGATSPSPEIYADAMQCCLTLGVFRSGGSIGHWIELPQRIAAFADATGVWLFDGETLTEAHARCLESIFKVLPRPQHGVCALFVPEAIPFSAEGAPLRLPGVALDVALAPMEMMRDVAEMPPFVPQSPVPEFTVMALEQVMRAVIAVRLAERADLAQRAVQVMRIGISMPDSALAHIAPEEILMSGAPDLFLGYLGVMWLMNSEALLESAVLLAEQGAPEALYALLLVADLFSMTGESTVLFRATPIGALTASETALRRVFIAPGVSYVNGIAVAGRIWQYDMSAIALM